MWPRGKSLGGSTINNAMMWVRGSRHDYDMWSEMGCDGWSYAEVLPYFLRMEDNQNEDYVKSGICIFVIKDLHK